MALFNKRGSRNLLTLVPVRRLEHRMEDTGEKATLIIPRFRTPWVRKILRGWMSSEWVEMKLDETGTTAWLAMDGSSDVRTISEVLLDKFGDKAEPVDERLSLFLFTLKRHGFIELQDPGLPPA